MIVVTGAAGRLGRWVAQRLTDEGFQLYFGFIHSHQ